MLCAPLDWQYVELPSSASDAVLCYVLVATSNQIEGKKTHKKNKISFFLILFLTIILNYNHTICTQS